MRAEAGSCFAGAPHVKQPDHVLGGSQEEVAALLGARQEVQLLGIAMAVQTSMDLGGVSRMSGLDLCFFLDDMIKSCGTIATHCFAHE